MGKKKCLRICFTLVYSDYLTNNKKKLLEQMGGSQSQSEQRCMSGNDGSSCNLVKAVDSSTVLSCWGHYWESQSSLVLAKILQTLSRVVVHRMCVYSVVSFKVDQLVRDTSLRSDPKCQ